MKMTRKSWFFLHRNIASSMKIQNDKPSILSDKVWNSWNVIFLDGWKYKITINLRLQSEIDQKVSISVLSTDFFRHDTFRIFNFTVNQCSCYTLWCKRIDTFALYVCTKACSRSIDCVTLWGSFTVKLEAGGARLHQSCPHSKRISLGRTQDILTGCSDIPQ